LFSSLLFFGEKKTKPTSKKKKTPTHEKKEKHLMIIHSFCHLQKKSEDKKNNECTF